MASKSAGNGHMDDKLIRAVRVADSLGRIIDDELAVAIAAHFAESETTPVGKLATGVIPSTWREWRALAQAVEMWASRSPGSVSIRQLGFWVQESARCAQCGVVMVGVRTGTNTAIDVEDCDECQRYNGPLEAAYALSLQLPGAQVWFYRHDPERFEELETLGVVPRTDNDELHGAGFRKLVWNPDKLGSVSVLSGTNPWIEINGEPVNWNHAKTVLTAVLAMQGEGGK